MGSQKHSPEQQSWKETPFSPESERGGMGTLTSHTRKDEKVRVLCVCAPLSPPSTTSHEPRLSPQQHLAEAKYRDFQNEITIKEKYFPKLPIPKSM